MAIACAALHGVGTHREVVPERSNDLQHLATDRYSGRHVAAEHGGEDGDAPGKPRAEAVAAPPTAAEGGPGQSHRLLVPVARLQGVALDDRRPVPRELVTGRLCGLPCLRGCLLAPGEVGVEVGICRHGQAAGQGLPVTGPLGNDPTPALHDSAHQHGPTADHGEHRSAGMQSRLQPRLVGRICGDRAGHEVRSLGDVSPAQPVSGQRRGQPAATDQAIGGRRQPPAERRVQSARWPSSTSRQASSSLSIPAAAASACARK